MLNRFWWCMAALSLVYSFLCGTAPQMLSAAIGGAASAVDILVNLCAGYLLFCGLLAILDALEASKGLERLLRPLLGAVMPTLCDASAKKAVVTNLAANLLGLGNAATPMGIEAMRLMEAESERAPAVRHDMRMLLILNATGLQLLPTTVLALRVAAGSANPNRVILPVLVCTLASTAVGAALGLLCRRASAAKPRKNSAVQRS